MRLSDRALLLAAVPILGVGNVAPVWAAGGEDLPQLDPTFYPAQLFWLLVFFGFLYLLMRFVALPSVQRTQDKRKHVIATELATARQANDEAKALMAEVDKSLAEARAKARVTVDEIRLATVNETTERLAEQQRGLVRRLRDAEAKIVTARVAALKHVEVTAKELSVVIAQRVSGLKIQGGRS